MIAKIFGAIIGLMVLVFACQWVFNHINPWLGILLGIAGAFFVINYSYNKIKNTK